MAALPLAGLRVLDFSRHFPGPYLTSALSDLGATVLKLEDPAFGDPTRIVTPLVPDGTEGALHAWLNRGKKSLAVDLKLDAGALIARTLAKKSDVVVESFRPGVMARLGLDARRLLRDNPRLLCVSLSGYGASGPGASRPTHDLNVVGETALIGPGAQAGNALAADTVSGLLALVAILARLQGRHRRDFKGGVIDLSILDGGLALAAPALVRHFADPSREHDELLGGFACYRTYLCADGRSMAVGALEPRFFETACETLGFPGHAKLQWSKRAQPAICADFEKVFGSRTQADWVAIFGTLDACVTPVQSIAEAAVDPQIAARKAFLPLETQKGAFTAPAFLPQVTGTGRRRRAPRHGEHTEKVLRSLGYSKTNLRELRATGVIS